MGHSRLNCPKLRCPCLLFAALLLLRFRVVISATNDTYRLALLAFKAEITSDPFRSLNSWNDSTDFCQWYGIKCGRRHHRVTVLHLAASGLSGPISPHIGNLSFLRTLSLQGNSFGLEIPPQIGRLHRLQILDLYNNSLTGKIPRNISGFSNLASLYLDYNQFVGGIPVELGSLSNLRYIGLSVNQLTGNIPSSIGNLSSLAWLFCSRNGLATIYRLGLACSVEEPKKRMSIDKVASQLQSIRKKLSEASFLG